MSGVWILEHVDQILLQAGSTSLTPPPRTKWMETTYYVYVMWYISFHVKHCGKENQLFLKLPVMKCKNRSVVFKAFFRTLWRKVVCGHRGSSKDGGCKKLACKCGWQGGGFLNTQPWCGVEHLGDTVYCLTSKSAHTHTHTLTVKAHSSTVEMRAPCPTDVSMVSEAASGTNLPAACSLGDREWQRRARPLFFYMEKYGSAANLLKGTLCITDPSFFMQQSM